MPVSNSSFSRGPAQADGRRWVTETHTLAAGDPVVLNYLAPADFDAQAAMEARVAQVNAGLVDAEASASMDREQAVTLSEMDKTTFLLRFRERYRAAGREDACRLAYWFARRLAAGHITDIECRQAFSLTNTQWSNFKANKLTPQHDAWAAVLAATGG